MVLSALLALLTLSIMTVIYGISRYSAREKAHRLKCLCKFKSVTPEEDLKFVQTLLHLDRKIRVNRLTKRMDGGETVFELEYSTDPKTQKHVLAELKGREGLRELRMLSGSEHYANVIFISKELSLSSGLRKEERPPAQKRTRHATRRRAS
jgi:hypothetical protein